MSTARERRDKLANWEGATDREERLVVKGFNAGIQDEVVKALVDALEKILRPGMQPDLSTLEVYSQAQITAWVALKAYNKAIKELECAN